MTDSPQLLRVGTVLRWTIGAVATVALAVILWGHGYWPLCIVPVLVAFRFRLVLEQRPDHLTDDEIWAWVDGHR